MPDTLTKQPYLLMAVFGMVTKDADILLSLKQIQIIGCRKFETINTGIKSLY